MKRLIEKRRIVIKIGSSLLTNGGVGIDNEFIRKICDQIVALIDKDYQVLLVSSGAVASDPVLEKEGSVLKPRSDGLRAAIGQPRLLNCYQEYFKPYKVEVAQFLISDPLLEVGKNDYTKDLLIEALNDNNVVPIINGHDTANDNELKMLVKCADNDSLCCIIAELIDATDVIIAIDEDGVIDNQGNVIRVVSLNNREYILGLAKKSEKTVGYGSEGMISKMWCLFALTSIGKKASLVPGRQENFILRAIAGEKNFGTVFVK